MKEWLKGFGKFTLGLLVVFVLLAAGSKAYILYQARSFADPRTAANVTMENFLSFKFGDSYESVCKVMGGEGTVLDANLLGGEDGFTVKWSGGVKGLRPRYIILSFNNLKRLDNKIQVGLGERAETAAGAYKNIDLGISLDTACRLAGSAGSLDAAVSAAYGYGEPSEDQYENVSLMMYTWKNGWGNGFQLSFFEGRLIRKRKICFGYLDNYKLIEMLGYVF